MQESYAVQRLEQAAARPCAAELTQRRKDYQTYLVQKAEYSSGLTPAAAALLLLHSTSVPVTDFVAENIGSKRRAHVPKNAAPRKIPP